MTTLLNKVHKKDEYNNIVNKLLLFKKEEQRIIDID